MASSNGANGSVADAAKAGAIVVEEAADSSGKIPAAVFFEDVAAASEKYGAEALIEQLSELAQKYRFWENKYSKSRLHLEQKIPDVRRALDAVQALEKQSQRAAEAGGSPLESNFELCDGLYVRASIPPTKTVCLWLGANCMVEYTFEEATQLLTKNLDAATSNLKQTEADIAYLRDQINTTDVNLSQVYNYRVQQTRKEAAKQRADVKS